MKLAKVTQEHKTSRVVGWLSTVITSTWRIVNFGNLSFSSAKLLPKKSTFLGVLINPQ